VSYAVCADIGSTFTKVALVALPSGRLLATAAHPTTVDTDVLHGLDAAAAQAAAHAGDAAGVDPRAAWYVCSSAGGGLRLAVVGHEHLVTAQAGRRVALSAGARVVHVAAGKLSGEDVAALEQARPDMVLLVGGTDGGEAGTLLHNADALARAGRRRPVVLAGNADAREHATAVLTRAGTPVRATANVLPRIGQLHPAPARAAIREAFLRHVIGGKQLSRGPRLAGLLRAATPDAVLAAVELLADHDHGDLLLVDVGGATTDIYSAVTPDTDHDADATAEVAGVLMRARTVEGDLGVRWSAPGVVAAAADEKLLANGEAESLTAAAQVLATAPGLLPAEDSARAHDHRLAALAAVVAVRRHARGEATGPVRRGGRDLRRVRCVIGSGGVLRHADDPEQLLATVVSDHAGGWALPRRAHTVVDTRYVLAAAGLLAGDHPQAALRLLREHLPVGNLPVGHLPGGEPAHG
jgi:uncharacterized protein (TIGR01319 family)